MKNKNQFFFIILIMIMIMPQLGIAQDHHAVSNSLQVESWKPVNKFAPSEQEIQATASIAVAPPLVNVLNGVSFYTKTSECAAEKVVLLKLINSNKYAVKVSWQMGATAPITSVVIPAAVDFEGSCPASSDANKAKLTVKLPLGSDKEEIKKYALSHVTVIEIK